MRLEKFETYLDIFLDLYSGRKLTVVWRSIKANFKCDLDITEILAEYGSGLKESDFIKSVFMIIDIAKAISTDSSESLKVFEPDYIEKVSKKFLTESSIISEIAINTLSSGNYIEDVRHEILTKRSNVNLEKIYGYALRLEIGYKDSTRPLEKLSIELTERELLKLIESLQNMQSDLNSLSKKNNS